jgi:hypothetical protein
VPVVAHFRFSLVLTYALPSPVLRPLLPPGLTLDEWQGHGFVAIALVQTEALRPVWVPEFCGQDFFLAGYRVFARHRRRDGRMLRGLRILRSDTDRWLMARAGNFLTHYNYRHSKVDWNSDGEQLHIEITSPGALADLALTADLLEPAPPLPERSVFRNAREARRFAGPLPFTFDYEPETHSMILIEGVRRNWHPRLVRVSVRRNTFIEQAPFNGVEARLSSAFYVAGIPYCWKRGIVEELPC